MLCHCRSALRAKGDSAPDDGFEMKQDSQGNSHRVPKGIDLGFDYAPGSNVDTSLRTMVQNKLIKHPQAISRALTRDINRYINANESVVGFAKARAITEKNNNVLCPDFRYKDTAAHYIPPGRAGRWNWKKTPRRNVAYCVEEEDAELASR